MKRGTGARLAAGILIGLVVGTALVRLRRPAVESEI